MLRLNVLGAFEALTPSGGTVDFATDKVRALFAYLALEADRPHARSTLAALLWPDLSDDAAGYNLRKTLYRLRQSLDQAAPGTSDQLLDISRQTVRLDPAELALDAAELEALVATSEGHDHHRLYTCAQCLDRLERAVALHRAELLQGLSLADAPDFEDWLLLRREAEHERLLAVLARLADAFERRRDYERAERHAARQIALVPWREEAHAQRIRTLALAGRTAEALAAYETCRRILDEELGVAPQPETTALVQRVQAGAAVGGEAAGVSVRSAPRPKPLHGFPVQFTPLVARETERQQVHALLLDPECRLLTITGAGGMGKTRLAVAAAEALAGELAYAGPLAVAGSLVDEPGQLPADGLYFVGLAGVQAVEGLPAAIAAALGLSFRAGQDAAGQLADYLRQKRCLLVLDNFEHLAPGAGLLADLLAAAPGLRLLVTSRQPLGLGAEHRLTLGGLASPAQGQELAGEQLLSFGAPQLFVQTASRARIGRTIDAADWAAVGRICRLVDGMPLALELAAAWTRDQSFDEVAEAIARDVSELTSPWQDVPARHGSIEAVFAHSWQLLPEAERQALARSSVFAGEFDFEAMLTVTRGSPADLAGLIDKSLVQPAGAGHYALHSLLRQFAARRLAGLEHPPDVAAETERRHAGFFLAQLKDCAGGLVGPAPMPALAAFRRSLDDARKAWGWAVDGQRYAVLGEHAAALARCYELAGLFDEAVSAFERAVGPLRERHRAGEALPDVERTALVKLLVWLPYLLYNSGRLDEALELAVQARDLADAAGLPGQQARASNVMGMAQMFRGDYDAAERSHEEAVALFRQADDSLGLADALNNLASLQLQRNRLAPAKACLEEAIRIHEAADYPVGAAKNRGMLSIGYARAGDFERARSEIEVAIAVFRSGGHEPALGMALGNCGVFCFKLGRDEESLDCLREALALSEAQGYRLATTRHLANLVNVLRRLGRLDEALACCDRAIELLTSAGMTEHQEGMLLEKAEVLVAMGEHEAAAPLVEVGLAAMAERGHHDHVVQGEILRAKVRAARGDPAGACEGLSAVLGSAEEDAERATVYFERWRLCGDPADARAAAALSTELLAQTAEHTHRLRLQELSTAVTA